MVRKNNKNKSGKIQNFLKGLSNIEAIKARINTARGSQGVSTLTKVRNKCYYVSLIYYRL